MNKRRRYKAKRRRNAPKVRAPKFGDLRDQPVIGLSLRDQETFVAALLEPPAPTVRLRQAADLARLMFVRRPHEG